MNGGRGANKLYETEREILKAAVSRIDLRAQYRGVGAFAVS